MFDYDARPVTPQVAIVGLRASSVGYQLRDFLSRNGVPYEWVEIDDTERVHTLLDGSDLGPDHLPICILPDGSRLPIATVEAVATGLGRSRCQHWPSTTWRSSVPVRRGSRPRCTAPPRGCEPSPSRPSRPEGKRARRR